MGQTVHQIEAHIERTRDQLGSNLHEFERRIDALTDWKEQFRARPLMLLGTAAIGGMVVAGLLRRTSSGQTSRALAEARVGPRIQASHESPTDQVLDVLNHMKTAIIAVAATRLKEYVDTILPGFAEHYQRAERHMAGGDGGSPTPGRQE